jgi:NAD(P)-dependent dehydrogenase (short-subunit alcohol dehydrogenase family)
MARHVRSGACIVTFSIDLSGHSALVTGGGQHTGRAFSMALADAGASVLVNDVVEEKAEAVAAEIRAAGGQATAAVFDITDLAAVQGALGAHPVDIVINNVGGVREITFPIVHFGESDPERWHRLVELNLFGNMNTAYAALPYMTEQGWGRFVTIISDAARRAERGMGVYGAAKAASAAFMRSLATEYGPQGITSNAISFGSLRYEGQPEADPETLKRMTRLYSVKRMGTPQDPVGLMLLLASDAASWITGQVIPVNGGYTNAL